MNAENDSLKIMLDKVNSKEFLEELKHLFQESNSKHCGKILLEGELTYPKILRSGKC